jgi:hypothetical protein
MTNIGNLDLIFLMFNPLDSRKTKLLITNTKTPDFSISSNGLFKLFKKKAKITILFLLKSPKKITKNPDLVIIISPIQWIQI